MGWVTFRPSAKGLARALPQFISARGSLCSFGLARLVGALRPRAGAVGGALGRGVAIDELDHGHRGVVAVAEARLHDAQIAAVAAARSAARSSSNRRLTSGSLPICAIAWRRACRSPRLPSVTSFSTIGRRSFAFGSVVTICSCSMSDAGQVGEHRLAVADAAAQPAAGTIHGAWLFSFSFGHRGPRDCRGLVMVFVTLGQLFDVLRRPVRSLPCRDGGPSGQALP